MGGNSYPRNVVSTSSSGKFPGGGTSSSVAKSAMSQQSYLSNQMDPKNRSIQSESNFIVLLGLDVTGSNIEFANICYDKFPMLYGQIIQQGYLPEVEISVAGVGDANSDRAPLQIADFASAMALDEWIERMYLEGNGGGQGMETYELWAYYYARKAIFKPTLGFGFLVVDEAPYSEVTREKVRSLIGDDLRENISTRHIFTELNRKLNGNLYILQNPYCGDPGSRTNSMTSQWKDYLSDNGGTLIPLKEEKSVIDIILGIIALKSGTRSLAQYQTDMANRKQSNDRIANVTGSINSASRAIVPVNNVGGNLPAVTDTTKRGSGSQRI